MIWLLSNIWWLVPALLGLVALGFAFAGPGLPVLLAGLRRVPAPVWAGLAAVALLGLTFQAGRWYERSAAKERQAAAEDRADTKAAKTAGRAAEKAEQATTEIRKESARVQVRIREVVRTVPGDCPAMPDELRDLLEHEVERTRAELPPAAGPGDR